LRRPPVRERQRYGRTGTSVRLRGHASNLGLPSLERTRMGPAHVVRIQRVSFDFWITIVPRVTGRVIGVGPNGADAMPSERRSRPGVRRGLIGLSAVLVLVALTGWNFTRSNALSEAEQAESRSDFPKALRLSLDHLRRRPWSRDAARLAARCLSRLDRPDEAEPYYRRSGPVDAADANIRAYAIERANLREPAIAAYRDILTRWPNDVSALSRLTTVYVAESRWPEALEMANRLASQPEAALTGHVLLAAIHHHANSPESAIAVSKIVLQLDPQLRSAAIHRETFLVQLAEDLVKQGRPTEARGYLTRGLESDDVPDLWYVMGRSYREEGNLADAERWWRRVANARPGYALVWLDLGRIEIETRRLERAVESLNRVLTLTPESQAAAEASYNLALVYRRLGRVEEAKGSQARFENLRRRLGTPKSGMGASSMPPS
jgi:tetratricopeptide (TPR) repeat protein